jgi:hypothetical protein
MQKVVGSSPIIRSSQARWKRRVFFVRQRPERNGIGLGWLSSAVEETVMARLVMVAGILALTAVLLAGCGGGGNDRAKVEASLQHYLASLDPEGGLFPIGAGPPRVENNGCKDRHVKNEKERVLSAGTPGRQVKIEKGVALWVCVVKFGTFATSVVVWADDSTEVVAAFPGKFKQSGSVFPPGLEP